MTQVNAQILYAEEDEVSSYRQGFQSLVRVVAVMMAIIFGLSCVVLYYVSSVLPQDRYFAETASGARMQMVDLGAPNVTNDMLLAWASQAVTDIMTFGFHDVNERFASTKHYFSEEGWQSFGQAMAKSSLLRNVMDLQQIITSIPRGTPTIAGSGFDKGVFVWAVQVPIIMTVRAGSNIQTKYQVVLLYIVKMPTERNPLGIGIRTWK